MTAAKRIIELDEATATTLESRAAERGLSASELIAEMTAIQSGTTIVPFDEISELDRRWAAIEAGEATIPHEEVARWLQTWGTPSYKPWNSR